MSATVYASLGSNVDREKNILLALGDMRQVFGRLILSRVYESVAVGFDGDDFLNLVAGFDSKVRCVRLVTTGADISRVAVGLGVIENPFTFQHVATGA